MVKTRIMYLGPLAALAHRGPSGITRNFFRNQWTDDDYSEDDLKHYSTSGGFKVERTVVKKTEVVPKIQTKEKEIVYES